MNQLTNPLLYTSAYLVGSMYCIFTYMWLIFMVNVCKYTMHGSCGYGYLAIVGLGFVWYIQGILTTPIPRSFEFSTSTPSHPSWDYPHLPSPKIIGNLSKKGGGGFESGNFGDTILASVSSVTPKQTHLRHETIPLFTSDPTPNQTHLRHTHL